MKTMGMQERLSDFTEAAREELTRVQCNVLSMMRRMEVGRGLHLHEHGRDEIEDLLRRTDRTRRGFIQSGVYPCLEKVPTDGLILDVGSSARCLHPRSLSIDILDGADLVWDLMRGLPFPSKTFDLCVCTAVLEHVREPAFLISEMRRILKPGGRIHAQVPLLQPFHAVPNDFHRYTETGVRHLFRHFQEENVAWCCGFGDTLAWILREWRAVALPELQEGILREVFVEKWSEFERAVAELDHNERLHADPKRGLQVAGGILFEGTK